MGKGSVRQKNIIRRRRRRHRHTTIQQKRFIELSVSCLGPTRQKKKIFLYLQTYFLEHISKIVVEDRRSINRDVSEGE